MNNKSRSVTLVAVGITAACTLGVLFHLSSDKEDEGSVVISRNSPATTPGTARAANMRETERKPPPGLADKRVVSRYSLESFPAEVVRDYKNLATAAESGDVGAAKQLYRLLLRCKGVPENYDEVKAVVEHERESSGGAQPTADTKTLPEKEWANCSTLRHDQRVSYAHWLAIAAQSGDAEAKLDYVMGAEPLPNPQDAKYWKDLDAYRTTARKYLDEGIAAGLPDALSVAASNYAGNGIYDYDRVKQYAYLYAFVLATGETSRAEFSILNELKSNLPEEQIQLATSEGEEIFRKCCSR